MAPIELCTGGVITGSQEGGHNGSATSETPPGGAQRARVAADVPRHGDVGPGLRRDLVLPPQGEEDTEEPHV